MFIGDAHHRRDAQAVGVRAVEAGHGCSTAWIDAVCLLDGVEWRAVTAPQLLSSSSPGRRRAAGVLTRKQTWEYRSLRALTDQLNAQG